MNNRVTIIMAAYNAEKYIEMAINSVLNQSYNNWELIIINDGSRDQTENIVTNFKDTRIIYQFQENKGVGSARNLGLSLMKGDYFCFLDADDFMPPDSIKSRIGHFKSHRDVNFVDGSIQVFDKNLMKHQWQWFPSFKGSPTNELIYLSGRCFFGLSWMIRRDKKKKYEFNSSITHGEDLLFYIELSKNGGLYDFVKNDILYYRKGHQSAMTNLKGLEKGYHDIYRLLLTDKVFSNSITNIFKKKAKKIIFMSYLGHFHPFKALHSLLKKW